MSLGGGRLQPNTLDAQRGRWVSFDLMGWVLGSLWAPFVDVICIAHFCEQTHPCHHRHDSQTRKSYNKSFKTEYPEKSVISCGSRARPKTVPMRLLYNKYNYLFCKHLNRFGILSLPFRGTFGNLLVQVAGFGVQTGVIKHWS